MELGPKGPGLGIRYEGDESSIRVECLSIRAQMGPVPPWRRQGQLEDTPVTDGVRWAHYAAALLVTAYFVSVALRHVGSYIAPIDGWGVDLFEVAVGVLCMRRYWHGSWRTMQSVVAYFPLVLGAACISWGFGDTALTIESSVETPPTPSVADGFGLMFFPLCYIALVMLLRSDSKGVAVTPWLDRAIGALGFASVAAAFALHPALNAVGGWSLATRRASRIPSATCCFSAS